MRHILALAAALALTGAAHAFDNAACPDYFVGDWVSETDPAKPNWSLATRFGADGSYFSRETSGPADDNAREMRARWSAKAGNAPDSCDITVTITGKKDEVWASTVLDQSRYTAKNGSLIFRRVQP